MRIAITLADPGSPEKDNKSRIQFGKLIRAKTPPSLFFGKNNRRKLHTAQTIVVAVLSSVHRNRATPTESAAVIRKASPSVQCADDFVVKRTDRTQDVRMDE